MGHADQTTGIWQERFEFFHAYGLPSSTPQAREAFKALPFWTRMRLNSNVLAFLFGPLYFVVKGMWRKGVVLLVLALTLGAIMVAFDVPDMVDRAASLVIPALAMTTANYAYYLHVVRGSRSWNPMEGFGLRSADRNAPRDDVFSAARK